MGNLKKFNESHVDKDGNLNWDDENIDLSTDGEYVPHYIIPGFDKMRDDLRAIGYDNYTPCEKLYKYKEKSALMLTYNALGDIYLLDNIYISSDGGYDVKFAPEWQYPKPTSATTTGNNSNYFLIIPYNSDTLNTSDYDKIKEIVSHKGHINFDRDKR